MRSPDRAKSILGFGMKIQVVLCLSMVQDRCIVRHYIILTNHGDLYGLQIEKKYFPANSPQLVQPWLHHTSKPWT